MPLFLGQLIYSSFPRVGFMCLASAEIPTKIRQAFMELVVYQYWDSYNPPKLGYRAVYLHQLTPEETLFGWLYNDGIDEFGRSNIPYFLCYYLEGLLETAQLETIFTCLHKGPLRLIERHAVHAALEKIVLPDLGRYQSARRGVSISSEVREQSYIALKQKKLLGLYVPADEREINTQLKEQSSEPISKTLKSQSQAVELKGVEKQTMATGKIEELLQELTSKPIGIQSAVLVSLEGQPITVPIGMDEDRVLILAGSMLYLARSVHEELTWNGIETVSVRGQDGHIILTSCTPDVFLLVKAGKALTGLLDGEINRMVKRLQAELSLTDANKMKMAEIDEPEVNTIPEFKTDTFGENNNELRYRGRRIGS
ncbi:MAG TPA: roadblock/LC7 domain-containing protein [Cyanophyceae cyanobacterium]